MEGADYALGAFDLCSASFGAPHIRQRLWFVADTDNPRSQGWIPRGSDTQRQDQHGHVGRDSATDGMDNAISDGRHEGRFGDHGRNDGEQSDPDVEDGRTKPTNGAWSDADWLLCRDGKWRPVRPESFPLAHGATARVGRLRAYGNAITAQVAQGLIESYMEVR
jgi:DNA (cytosine-5)-methyltransferase 1